MDQIVEPVAVIPPEQRNPLTFSLSANLYSHRGKLPVKIVDLSGEEAVVSAQTIPDIESVVILARGGVKRFAVVTWVEGQRVGLRFSEPFAGPRQREAFLAVKTRRLPPPSPIAMDTLCAA